MGLSVSRSWDTRAAEHTWLLTEFPNRRGEVRLNMLVALGGQGARHFFSSLSPPNSFTGSIFTSLKQTHSPSGMTDLGGAQLLEAKVLEWFAQPRDSDLGGEVLRLRFTEHFLLCQSHVWLNKKCWEIMCKERPGCAKNARILITRAFKKNYWKGLLLRCNMRQFYLFFSISALFCCFIAISDGFSLCLLASFVYYRLAICLREWLTKFHCTCGEMTVKFIHSLKITYKAVCLAYGWPRVFLVLMFKNKLFILSCEKMSVCFMVNWTLEKTVCSNQAFWLHMRHFMRADVKYTYWSLY